jgi:hypothetical protein
MAASHGRNETTSNDVRSCVQDIDILEHLQAIDLCHSDFNMYHSDMLTNCLYHAESSGMWKGGFLSEEIVPDYSIEDDAMECITADNTEMETTWDCEYKKHWDAWKKKFVVVNDLMNSNINISGGCNEMCETNGAICDDSVQICQDIRGITDSAIDVNIDDMVC